MTFARITGTGGYLPERVMSNEELERMVDTSDEWIRERSGIKRRHIAADDEKTSDMGLAAARKALDAAVYSVLSFEYNQDLQVAPAAPRPAVSIARELRKIRGSGGREDGYAALEAMLGHLYDDTPQSIWLVTDEWRNVQATPADFDGMLRLLEQRELNLHAIVRADFNCDDGSRAFGERRDRSRIALVVDLALRLPQLPGQ